MVKPTYAGGISSNSKKAKTSQTGIASTIRHINSPNLVIYWLSGLLCVCILLNSTIVGFGNFGRAPGPQKSSLRLLPAWFRDEVSTTEPTPADTNPGSTPAPESIHNISPTSAVETTPDVNTIGTLPPPVKTEPVIEATLVPTETPLPPPSPTDPPRPTSTDVLPTAVIPSDTQVPVPTTAVPIPSNTVEPTITKIPPPVETTVVPTEENTVTPVAPTAIPTTAVPPTAVTPTSIPKPVDPSATPVENNPPTVEPTLTDVPVQIVTKPPTRAPTRVPIGTAVKPPTSQPPIISVTPLENSVPDIPLDKDQATPVVGEGKPTTMPNSGTVMAPPDSTHSPTITPAVIADATNNPQGQQHPQENVFLPAMPAVEPTSVIPASPTPKSLEEFVQTTAPKNHSSTAAQQFVGPILVYTYTQKMLAEGLYVVAACVANVGDQADSSVTLSFNSVAPVVIQHLLSASEFGEIDQNQRGFVNIASLPPERQKQFELVVTAPEMPLPELMSINLSRGYKLNRPNEANIKCEPQGTLSKLPEFAPVEITIGGEEVPPGTIAELAAKQLDNPTQRARDAQNKQPPSSWNIPYDNTYLIFVGVITAMAGVFGLMTIGRRMRP